MSTAFIMKRTHFISSVAAVGFFGSTSFALSQTAAPAVESTVPAVKDAPAIALNPKFAAYGGLNLLSPNTDAFVSFYDIKDALDQFKGTGLGKLLSRALEDEEGMTLAEALLTDNAKQILSYVGEELFLSFGKGTSTQADGIFKLLGLMNEAQIQTLIEQGEILTKKEEDAEVFLDNSAYLFKMLEKKDIILPILTAAEMPPIIAGLKISDDNLRAATLMQLQGGMGMAMMMNAGEEPMILTVNKEVAGAKFSGIQLSGKALVSQQGEMLKGPLSETLGAEGANQIIEAAKKNSLTVMVGEKEGYIIVYLGKTPDDLTLAEGAKSLATSEPLNFTETYGKKRILSALYTSKNLMGTLGKHRYAFDKYAKGAIAGLQNTTYLGDTADLETLLQAVADAEKASWDGVTVDRYGSVAFIEDGIKFENYGGTLSPDWSQPYPSKFSALENQPDVALIFSGYASKKSQASANHFLNLLGEAAYLAATKLTKVKNLQDVPDLKKFIEGFGLFDKKFKIEGLQIWNAITEDFNAAIGEQGVLVMDLKGSFPTVPNVPAAVLKNGRLPRLAIAYDVIDRAKAASSWEKIDQAATSIVKKIGEMQNEKIPMIKPLSGENNGLKSYFYALPFFTDQFTPAISLNDESIFFSNSKAYSESLVKAMGDATTAPVRKGFVAKMNFEKVKELGDYWVQLIEKDPKAILETESAVEDFKANKKEIEQALEVIDSLGKLHFYMRGEDNEYRGSLHIQAK